MSDAIREAFEAWYNEEYVRPIIPADRTEGGYQHPDAQAAWDAWQAALQQTAPAEAREAIKAEALRDMADRYDGIDKGASCSTYGLFADDLRGEAGRLLGRSPGDDSEDETHG